MPPSAKKKLTSWSFSRYNDYRQCPFKAQKKHIDKLKEPPNPAMERGAKVAGDCEQYIKGTLKRLPAELAKFKDLFTDLKKRYKSKGRAMVVEDMWAFTETWEPTRWDDWTGCRLRVKIDVAYFLAEDHLNIDDFKTGKFRPEKNDEYLEQLELYVTAALVMYPEQGLRVTARLVYLDEGLVHTNDVVYTHKDLPRLKKLWAQRTKKMLTDTAFVPRPSNLCRWCHFSKSNGGPCKF